jgi:regulator of replication initiation timing
MEKDIISKIIESHYNLFNDYGFEEIKKHLEENSNIYLEDEVLRRRIEKIKNENNTKDIPKN